MSRGVAGIVTHAAALAAASLAAALLSASAATAQVAPQLPNAALGMWCFHKAYVNDPDPHIIWPDAKDFDECANRGGIRFWKRGGKWGYELGRFDARTDCEITKVVRTRSNVYRVRSRCLDRSEHFKLWRSKTGMHWRDLEEDRK